MDFRNLPASDFTHPGEVSRLSTDNVSAKHYIKLNKMIELTGASVLGDVEYEINLDTTLDEELLQLAKAYEKYGINDVRLEVQASSPLGTSSGCLQMAFMPDPENGNYTPLGSPPVPLTKNLFKAVRQAGSKVIRPRESLDETINLSGTLYTKRGGSTRLSSFGKIVFCVRAVPDATDYVSFVVTFTCTVALMRTAVVDDGSLLSINTTATVTKQPSGKFEFQFAAEVPFNAAKVTFKNAQAIRLVSTNNNGTVSKVAHVRQLDLRFVNAQLATFTPNKRHQISNFLGVIINCPVTLTGISPF